MNNQLKYIVTYGHSTTAQTFEVYAFDVMEAIQIANKVTAIEVGLSAITQVKQISDLKKYNNS